MQGGCEKGDVANSSYLQSSALEVDEDLGPWL